MDLTFYKYNSTGNDFIFFDARERAFDFLTSERIEYLCHRQFGIGADGIILLKKSKKADLAMQIFNSDGSEAEMCANGARAFVHFAHFLKAVKGDFKIELISGIYPAKLEDENLATITLSLDGEREVNFDKNVFADYEYKDHFNTGVPHLILSVEDVGEVDVDTLGRKYRHHEMFEKGTNVNFYQVVKENQKAVAIRTYERGVEGETLCCGTGVMATALACRKNFGWTDQIQFYAPGGDVEISFSKDGKSLNYSGRVEQVYTGTLKLDGKK